MSVVKQSVRTQFFQYIFGDDEGFICISSADELKGGWIQRYFKWPEQSEPMERYISARSKKSNIWFCTSLLSEQKRVKENCLPGRIVWADLDYVPDASKIEPVPSLLVESSNKRYQAYWRVEKPLPPEIQEDYSRRLAYHLDADKSGWDLSQLLRVPFTFNLKYPNPPQVAIKHVHETFVPVEVLDALPDPALTKDSELVTEDMPDIDKLPDAEHVIYSYRLELREVADFAALYAQEPDADADWSRMLWRILRICFEVGMTREEAFSVAMGSAVNKYERDNRPVSYLWRDVVKADLTNTTAVALGARTVNKLEMPTLVDEDSFAEDSLVGDYKKWGEAATDAPVEYHELCCFIALSAVLCEGLKLATSFTEALVPNLWGLVLGESTLTRKTTCMKMVESIILDLDPDSLIASADGSVEGMLTGLSARPSRMSLYYKDEVSGFFDAINRKDYLAGMQETLTQLYDVPRILRRPLRKETIVITEPYFIFFGGGIRDKVHSLVSEEYVLSGFLPRFLVVSGENDLARVRRTGPPNEKSMDYKQHVVNRFVELKERYTLKSEVEVAGQTMVLPIRYTAKLEDKAWELYGDIEMDLIKYASDSPMQMVALPTFQRLAFSMLKMSMLIAATRREPDKDYNLHVTVDDVKQAAWYIQKWGKYSVELILNAGRPSVERILDKIMTFISLNQNCSKSDVMNAFHLSSKDARETLDTLSERGLIITKKSGRGIRLTTVI